MTEVGGPITRKRDKKVAEISDCNAIMAELKSQKQEFTTLKAQISETQNQISGMQSSLETPI